jgi:hypothetical protein
MTTEDDKHVENHQCNRELTREARQEAPATASIHVEPRTILESIPSTHTETRNQLNKEAYYNSQA